MLVIVSYDITDDHTRTYVRNLVRNNGLIRLQKSVYVGDVDLETFTFLVKYFKKFRKRKEKVEVEIFRLCRKCENRFRRLKNRFIKELDMEVIFIQSS
ncbi:MAG: CRISPR-associated endonuclease Cas2 [Candidatus Syntropharchaeia archaeon]